MEVAFLGTLLLILASTFVWIKLKETKKHHFINRYTQSLVDAIPNGFLLVNHNNKIVMVNDQACIIFGYTAKELLTKTPEDLMPHRFRKRHKHDSTRYYKDPSIRPMGMGRDLTILTKEGKEVDVEIALGFAPDTNDNVNAIVLIYDITVRKENERKISYYAFYDHLTDLPNRRSFIMESKRILNDSRARNIKTGFLILDIDGFKKINDTFGHSVGDDILKDVADTLQNAARLFCNEPEKGQCFPARLGGDEFILIIQDVENSDVLTAFISYMMNAFHGVYTIEGRNENSVDIPFSLSIGASVFPDHGVSVSQMLKSADVALFEAKRRGRGNAVIDNDNLNSDMKDYKTAELALRNMVDNKDFDLHYQPIWDINDNMIVGAEALFRGKEEKHPNISLAYLINVAEETELIVSLGYLIFERACEESRDCCTVLNSDMVISVNFSALQVEHEDFVKNVIDITKKVGVSPRNIAIEVTETILLRHKSGLTNNETSGSMYWHNNDLPTDKLDALRDYGFQVYIDDFGKGYSSLTQLLFLPFDKLKMDMDFIHMLGESSDAKAIVKSIIDLGHNMGSMVLAEGVETKTQINILKELGCNLIQGYYISEPLPKNKFITMYERVNNDKCN